MDSSSPLLREKIQAEIEAQGQRQTRTKTQIADRLAELADEQVDFTVEELWRDLRRVNPHIGRATVFRVVERLVNVGLINRIDFADGSHTYRACGEKHHHHLTCVQCHRVVDIDICLPNELLDKIVQQTDFLITGHSLTVFGLCTECRKSLN